MALAAAAFACITLAASQGHAATLRYTIAFTDTGDQNTPLIAAPTGGCEFNTATDTVSDFIVHWDGIVFDLTPSANAMLEPTNSCSASCFLAAINVP
jgi:hypothetical protein